MKDNIIEFPTKPTFDEEKFITEWFIQMDDLPGVKVTEEELQQLFAKEIPQDTQLDQLADACFDLQLLCDQHPELLQFVIKSIEKLTENMKKRLT